MGIRPASSKWLENSAIKGLQRNQFVLASKIAGDKILQIGQLNWRALELENRLILLYFWRENSNWCRQGSQKKGDGIFTLIAVFRKGGERSIKLLSYFRKRFSIWFVENKRKICSNFCTSCSCQVCSPAVAIGGGQFHFKRAVIFIQGRKEFILLIIVREANPDSELKLGQSSSDKNPSLHPIYIYVVHNFFVLSILRKLVLSTYLVPGHTTKHYSSDKQSLIKQGRHRS